MNIKTYGLGSIDWTGFKSVLQHLGWSLLLTALFVIVSYFQGHDFGVYQIISVPLGTFFAAYIKKLAETYSVTLPDTTVKVTDNTGAVTPTE